MKSSVAVLYKISALIVIFSLLLLFFISWKVDAISILKVDIVPFDVEVAVALESGCSLDQITSITGSRIETLDYGKELWKGSVTIESKFKINTINYEIILY